MRDGCNYVGRYHPAANRGHFSITLNLRRLNCNNEQRGNKLMKNILKVEIAYRDATERGIRACFAVYEKSNR